MMKPRKGANLLAAVVLGAFGITAVVRWFQVRECACCGGYTLDVKDTCCPPCAEMFARWDAEEEALERQAREDQAIADTYDELEREFWNDVRADIEEDMRLGVS